MQTEFADHPQDNFDGTVEGGSEQQSLYRRGESLQLPYFSHCKTAIHRSLGTLPDPDQIHQIY